MGTAGLVVLIYPKFFLRGILSGFWEPVVTVLGVSLILLGQIIRVSARGYKAENSLDSRALIQGGPYQLVRNPMYLGIFLIGLGIVLAIFQWWAVAIFIVVFIIRYISLIYQEEKKLAAFFPQAYPQYCRNVPRIIPAVARLMKLKLTDYLPLKIGWFYREIGSISSLLGVVLIVECWKDLSFANWAVCLRQILLIILIIFIFWAWVILLSKWTKKNNENIPK